MTRPSLRPMGIGEVLDRSFQVLRSHFGVLVGTALAGMSPLLLLYLAMGVPYGTAAPGPDASPAMVLALVALFALMGLATAVVWAALTHQVDRAAAGEAVTVGAGLRKGIGSLLRLVGAGIMVYLALLGVMIPAVLIGFAGAGIAGALLGTGVAAGLVTAVAFGVPGAIAIVVWSALAFLIVPAVVLDGLGPIRALRRANQLAKGGRIRVFATAILAWLVVMLPAVGLPFMLGIGMAVWDPQAAGQMSTLQLYLYQALSFGVSALTTPFLAAAMVYTYYDRRVRREGYDVELASAAMQPAL